MKTSFAYALLAFAVGVQACGSDPEPGTTPKDAGAAGRGGSGGTGGTGGGAGSGGSGGNPSADATPEDRDASDGSSNLDADGSVDVANVTSDGAADRLAPESGKDAETERDASMPQDVAARDAPADSPVDQGAATDADSSAVDAADAKDSASVTDATGPSDASDASTADAAAEAEAGPWTPAQLSNLALWLEADMGVTTSSNAVLSWADHSGHGHLATQVLADWRPTIVASALHGHSVVRFDGQNDSLSIVDAASLRWGTGDFVVEVVASFTNATNVGDGYGLLFAKQTAPYPFSGPALWANYAFPSSTTAFVAQLEFGVAVSTQATGLNDGAARVYGARRAGTTLETRLTGILSNASTVASVDVSAPGQFLFIGGQSTSNGVIQALQGDVAEIVAVGGSVGSADLAKLEGYLKAKYGL
jgi:hypothetical protein